MTEEHPLRSYGPWLVALALLLVGLWQISPILMPFIVGGALAYAGNPVVTWLNSKGYSRTLGVALVFSSITLVSALMIFLCIPILAEQAEELAAGIPRAIDWLRNHFLPSLGIKLPRSMGNNMVRNWISEHWEMAGGAAGIIAKSSLSALVILANIALIPVIAFYLLRDWPRLLDWVDQTIPPRHQTSVRRIAAECDMVLSSFLRGQALVMGSLAIFYGVALSILGLPMAFLVALIAGLLSFVPYLGFGVGLITALLAVLIDSPSLGPVLWVCAIFGLGQLLEGNILVPWLVGEQIGLHPVAVIFAVMAGGQLFGFTGILVALPVAALLLVLLREVQSHWLRSSFYSSGPDSDDLDDTDAAPPDAEHY